MGAMWSPVGVSAYPFGPWPLVRIAGSQMTPRVALAVLLLCGAGAAAGGSRRGLRASTTGTVLSPGLQPGPCPSGSRDLPEPFAIAMKQRPFDLRLTRAAWYATAAAGTRSPAQTPAHCVARALRGPLEHYEVQHVGDAEPWDGKEARLVVATARLPQGRSSRQHSILVAVPELASRGRGASGRPAGGKLGACSVGNRCVALRRRWLSHSHSSRSSPRRTLQVSAQICALADELEPALREGMRLAQAAAPGAALVFTGDRHGGAIAELLALRAVATGAARSPAVVAFGTLPYAGAEYAGVAARLLPAAVRVTEEGDGSHACSANAGSLRVPGSGTRLPADGLACVIRGAVPHSVEVALRPGAASNDTAGHAPCFYAPAPHKGAGRKAPVGSGGAAGVGGSPYPYFGVPPDACDTSLRHQAQQSSAAGRAPVPRAGDDSAAVKQLVEELEGLGADGGSALESLSDDSGSGGGLQGAVLPGSGATRGGTRPERVSAHSTAPPDSGGGGGEPAEGSSKAVPADTAVGSGGPSRRVGSGRPAAQPARSLPPPPSREEETPEGGFTEAVVPPGRGAPEQGLTAAEWRRLQKARARARQEVAAGQAASGSLHAAVLPPVVREAEEFLRGGETTQEAAVASVAGGEYRPRQGLRLPEYLKYAPGTPSRMLAERESGVDASTSGPGGGNAAGRQSGASRAAPIAGVPPQLLRADGPAQQQQHEPVRPGGAAAAAAGEEAKLHSDMMLAFPPGSGGRRETVGGGARST